ncbi:hypothetical protein M0Q50_04530 [bacterium]|nr:hypothetical protein [bacterium]
MEKIDILTNQIDCKNKINIKKYHDFFKLSGTLFTKYNPRAITIYTYEYRYNLKNVIIHFLYQLSKKDDKYIPVFNNDLNGVPITNLKILLQIYSTRFIVIDDMEQISDYDIELYNELKTNDIEKLILVNFYNNDEPLGFVVLSFTDKNKIDIVDLYNNTQKLTKQVLDILY